MPVSYRVFNRLLVCEVTVRLMLFFLLHTLKITKKRIFKKENNS